MTADAVGGVWCYAVDLARELAGQGVETTLVALGPAPAKDQLAEAEAVPGLRLIRADLPLEWLALSGSVIEAAGSVVAAMARECGADLVHLNTPSLAAEGGFDVPVVVTAHSCVATWWNAVKQGPLPEDFAWRTALTRRGYARADAVIAPSAAFAELTRETYAMSSAPRVVHNGRALAAVTPPRESGDFVFTAGRLWDEGKGLPVLDGAAQLISAMVVAAGPLSGPHGQSVRLPHVRTLGRVDAAEIARRVARRPVFVSTAFYEPFGLAVLEAAQAGCPLVLSDIASFRELWGGAAVFVPPGDAASLAAMIQQVLLDPELRESLGGAARERAARYTVEAMAAGVLAVYADTLGAGREAAA